MQKFWFVGAFLSLTAVCAQQKDSMSVSLDEVVISDTRFELKKEKSGKVIVSLTRKDFENKPGQSLAAVLNSVAGVEINGGNSANGKNLGYYIRGGKNQQVLILINGNPVTDASGISFEYDLRLLPADQVERVEIMKGAAGTLYGTGAATAVINITLKKAGSLPFQGTAYVNMGTQNTATQQKISAHDFNQGLSFNGTTGKVNYLASLNSTETNGTSQTTVSENSVAEPDRFSRQNLMFSLGYKPTNHYNLNFFGNYDRIANAYDGIFDNTGLNDTPSNFSQSEQFRFGFNPKFTWKNGEVVLHTAFTQLQRDYTELNNWTSQTEYTVYDSRSVNTDLTGKLKLNEQLVVISGLNFQFHDMQTESPYGNIVREAATFRFYDPYATVVWQSNFGFNLNTGARLNSHSQYGTQWVYTVNPSFTWGKAFQVKTLASYSTAVVAPSLYQLYSPYGNSNLTPEKNATIEAGIETTTLDKKFNFSIVGFLREQHNSFGFFFDSTTFASYYINIEGKNKVKGLETEVRCTVLPQLSLTANYTFTQPDAALLRLIPKQKINLAADFTCSPRWSINANWQFTGARTDSFYDGTTFAVTDVTLDAYSLLNASTRYQLIKNRMAVFGSVTNITNASFTEISGYTTLGRNFRLGVSIQL